MLMILEQASFKGLAALKQGMSAAIVDDFQGAQGMARGSAWEPRARDWEPWGPQGALPPALSSLAVPMTIP